MATITLIAKCDHLTITANRTEAVFTVEKRAAARVGFTLRKVGTMTLDVTTPDSDRPFVPGRRYKLGIETLAILEGDDHD